MQLSIRMQAVADMVTPGGRIADIGTDHGYVPIYLVEQNKADHAIAMDVRKGPLARAGENIVRFGCSDRIETRLSDGLAMLKPGEADTVIIAGMGGLHGFQIVQEKMLIDEGKYYVVMRVLHGEERIYTEAEDIYGRFLINEKHPVLKEYLEKQKAVKEKLLLALKDKTSEKSHERQQELLHELQIINETITRMVDENAEQRPD